MTPQDLFIKSLVPDAQACHKKYGIPASVTIAQAIFESSWGRSGLCLKANNYFGVKADSSWHGDKITMPTGEYVKGTEILQIADFRKYPSLAASIEDHATFLCGKRYGAAHLAKDGKAFAMAIDKAGYATDPNYGKKLCDEIDSRNLLQYDVT